jgi:hypothetical protein
MPGEELKALADFDWSTYAIMADELGQLERRLTFEIGGSGLKLRPMLGV